MIFAKAGDLVTCENGHPICTVAVDLNTQAKMTSAQFKDWQIDIDTSPGVAMPSCPICGAKFIGHPPGTFPDGGKIFINGEWLPRARSN